MKNDQLQGRILDLISEGVQTSFFLVSNLLFITEKLVISGNEISAIQEEIKTLKPTLQLKAIYNYRIMQTGY